MTSSIIDNSDSSIDITTGHEYRIESDARLHYLLAKEKLQRIASWHKQSQPATSFVFYLPGPDGTAMEAPPAEGDLVVIEAPDLARHNCRSWFIIDRIAENQSGNSEEYQFLMRSIMPPNSPRNLTREATLFSIVLRRSGERLTVELRVGEASRLDCTSGQQPGDRLSQMRVDLQAIADDLVKPANGLN